MSPGKGAMNGGSPPPFRFLEVGAELNTFQRQATIQSGQVDHHILDIHLVKLEFEGLNTVIN